MVKLKLEKTIKDETGEVPVADDYGYVAELVESIKDKIRRELTIEEEYTFYQYMMDTLWNVEFIEGDD